MYRYRPDIVAQTKIPGHIFVNWSFTMKFVPPALFLACQTVLIPAIFFQGRWNTAVSAACAASFLVPAATAILGRWILVLRVVHAPLAFLTLGILAS
jgi:methyl-accepting chemotaxis protein